MKGTIVEENEDVDDNYNDDYFSTDEFSDEDELCGMLPPPYPPPPPPTLDQPDTNNGKYI